MKFTKKIGTILLCAFLVLHGLTLVMSLSFQGSPLVLGGLAIAAGVFLFLER